MTKLSDQNKYDILSTAKGLAQFSVKELAEFAKVSEAQVKQVMTEHKNFFKKSGKKFSLVTHDPKTTTPIVDMELLRLSQRISYEAFRTPVEKILAEGKGRRPGRNRGE